jgi:hypothetical protein
MHHHGPTAPAVEIHDRAKFGLLPTIFLVAAAIGLIGCLVGFFVDRQQFAFSWLFACTFFFTLACGGMFWTLIHHATDAEWSVLVRRQLENIGSVIPYFFVLFLPLIAFCAPYLWKWWNPEALSHADQFLLEEKSGYLNHTFFWVRYVVYFVSLGGLMYLLRRWSIAQDANGASRYSHWMRRWGVGGLLVFGICLTFAAVDWLMGLQFLWYSTMWGVYIFAGTAGAGMSLLVIIVTLLRSQGYLKPITLEHYHMMGKWMFAFTIFWAYIGFDQYMLIWYANIPEENIFFRVRNTESWHVLSTLLVVGRFFIPFPILLTQWIKKHPHRLCYLACWILVMQLLDIYVVVLPALYPTGVRLSVLDFTSFLAVGGIVGWIWLRKVGSAPLFPTRDPRLSGSLTLTN